MIKHIVMFELKQEAGGKSLEENLKQALDMLKDFKARIPSLEGFEVRTNAKEAPADNYHLALICEFKDMNGLNAYQNHPVHKAFGAFITPVREKRACIDYEY